jgi:UDP-N-acetylglucosamine 2-epimerase (non-hydrolysing)
LLDFKSDWEGGLLLSYDSSIIMIGHGVDCMDKNKFKVFNVVGARPNMMKMAPIMAEMRRHSDLHPVLVHTGQHYDFAMSQVFLEQLNLGEPDHNLQVGSGTHHAQTAEVMRRFGELVQAERPDLIVVAGDVNSTMACALVGAKELIPVAHVESGLRSFDRTMPEEINRVVTDSVADILFTTEASAAENLLHEGIDPNKIHFVGNVMIDSLVYALEAARKSPIRDQLGVQRGEYVVLTLHRPANVDDPVRLRAALEAIAKIPEDLPVIFPIHPRTASRAMELHIPEMQARNPNGKVGPRGIWTLPPASYIDFLGLVDSAAMVITDSGGIQEETTYLGVPCLTFRDNTERPVTVTEGTNRLIGTDPQNLLQEAGAALTRSARRTSREYTPPGLWDGHASERIVSVLRNYLAKAGIAVSVGAGQL